MHVSKYSLPVPEYFACGVYLPSIIFFKAVNHIRKKERTSFSCICLIYLYPRFLLLTSWCRYPFEIRTCVLVVNILDITNNIKFNRISIFNMIHVQKCFVCVWNRIYFSFLSHFILSSFFINDKYQFFNVLFNNTIQIFLLQAKSIIIYCINDIILF